MATGSQGFSSLLDLNDCDEDLDYEPEDFDFNHLNGESKVNTTLPAHNGLKAITRRHKRYLRKASAGCLMNEFRNEKLQYLPHATRNGFRDNIPYLNFTVLGHLDLNSDEDDSGDVEETNDKDFNFSINSLLASQNIDNLRPLDTDLQAHPHLTDCVQSTASTDYENMIAPKDLTKSPSVSVKSEWGTRSICSSVSKSGSVRLENSSSLSGIIDTKDLNAIKMNEPNVSKRSKNFTIQVNGGQRFCIIENMKQKKPWKSLVSDNYVHISQLKSTDEVILYRKQESSVRSTVTENSLESSIKSAQEQQSQSNTSKEPECVFKLPVCIMPAVKRVPVVEKKPKPAESVEGCDGISLFTSTSLMSEDTCNTYIPEMDSFKKLRMNNWINQAENSIKTVTGRVPPVFFGLCFKHFFSDRCASLSCKNSHLLQTPLTKVHMLPNLPEDELMEAYNFAKATPLFYKKIYKLFAECFGLKDNKQQLIHMTHLVFDEPYGVNKVEGLRTVLKSLQLTDLKTLGEAVEYVLLEVGLRTYPDLGETLIEVIIFFDDDLLGRWPILRRLFIAGEKVPSVHANHFITTIMKEPIQIDICKQILAVITKYGSLDLQMVKLSLKEAFIQVCNQDQLDVTRSCLTSNGGDWVTIGSNSNSSAIIGKNYAPQSSQNASIGKRASSGSDSSFDTGFIASCSEPGPLIRMNNPRQRSLSYQSLNSTAMSEHQPPGSILCEEANIIQRQTQESPSVKRRRIDLNNARNNRSAIEFDQLSLGGISNSSNRCVQQQQQQPNRPEVINPALLPTTDPKSEIDGAMLPEQPQFGNVVDNPYYTLNVSLHIDYLAAIDNLFMEEEDIDLLNSYIKNGNGKSFLDMLFKYRQPSEIHNFISMALAHLKSTNQMIGRTYKRLLDSIERLYPNFYGNVTIRVVLEVITMNTLFLLEALSLFQDAKDLLMKFTNWDSLVTSRLFTQQPSSVVLQSIATRYLFIAKMLARVKPEYTYEILTCPAFRFLEESQKWPSLEAERRLLPSKLQCRNIALDVFLKNSYTVNIVTVIYLYKTILRKGIWSFDAKGYIDPMCVDLINFENVYSVKQVYKELDLLGRYLNSDTLRALLVFLRSSLTEDAAFKLYERCVVRNIYSRILNNHVIKHVVEIKTNMLQVEIELIISYYFHKFSQLRQAPSGNQNLIFTIKLPGESQNHVLAILNVNYSILDVNVFIRKFLEKQFSLVSVTRQPNEVIVLKADLIKYLEQSCLRTQNGRDFFGSQ